MSARIKTPKSFLVQVAHLHLRSDFDGDVVLLRELGFLTVLNLSPIHGEAETGNEFFGRSVGFGQVEVNLLGFHEEQFIGFSPILEKGGKKVRVLFGWAGWRWDSVPFRWGGVRPFA